jgi:uncharacterized protein YutE (UPF0331/DUF86 family)
VYFVDRTLLHNRLDFIEQLLHSIRGIQPADSDVERLAYERATHMLIEAMLDVGNQMIDGFMMKDPGSYEDIVRVLCDEGVLPAAEADALITFVSLRKMLIQQYTAIDMEQVVHRFEQSAAAWQAFPDRVRQYLTKESGLVVNAFRPDKED